eukprot:scaffold199535_cov26-Tisochrysis_lutea.AAC.4
MILACSSSLSLPGRSCTGPLAWFKYAHPLADTLLHCASAPGFDDEDDAAFYLQLPDLRAALPAVLFEGSAPGAPATAEASRNTNEASSKDVPSDASGFDEAIATLSACTSKAEIDNLASELCIRGEGLRLHRSF